MIRLLYFSEADPTLTSADIKEIGASAQRNNREKDISGIMVSGGRIFLQILEGPEESVLRLYLKILHDKRHHDAEIMRVTPIDQRLFADWSMEYFESAPLQFQQVLLFKAAHFALGEPAEFIAALRAVVNDLRREREAAVPRTS